MSGEFQSIMYNEKIIYSSGGKEMITTTHAYGDAGYLITLEARKAKKKSAVQGNNAGNKDQGC